MHEKVTKGIILFVLCAILIKNITHIDDSLYNAIVYSRINFILFVAILYFASYFIEICKTLCIVVLGLGLLFHGYMYYNAYMAYRTNMVNNKPVVQCGQGTSWYSKLNEKCY